MKKFQSFRSHLKDNSIPFEITRKSQSVFKLSLLSAFLISVAAPSFAAQTTYIVGGANHETNVEVSENLNFKDSLGVSNTEGDHYAVIVTQGGQGDGGHGVFTGETISYSISDLSGLDNGTQRAQLMAFSARNNSTLDLGGSNTKEINVNIAGTVPTILSNKKEVEPVIYGLYAIGSKENSPTFTVTAEKLQIDINVDGSDGKDVMAYGIYAQGNVFKPEDALNTKIEVNADTNINVKGPISSAVVAFSGAEVQLNKNVYINLKNDDPAASRSIVTRGPSLVSINSSGENTVQINGNVDFAYRGTTDINSTVDVTLKGSDSFWHGSAVRTTELKASDTTESVKKDQLQNYTLNLKVEDNATWRPVEVKTSETENSGAYYAPVSSLTLNDGIIKIENNNQPVVVKALSGKGTLNIEAASSESGVTSGQFVVGETEMSPDGVVLSKENTAEDGTNLNVNFVGITSDDLTSEEFAALSENVLAKGATQTQMVAEGLINGQMVQQVNTDGEVVTSEIAVNTVNQSLRDIGAMTFLSFRTAINDLDKRLGDLRSYSGENGAWVRYLGGQNRYGSHNMKLNYNGFQAGFDHRFSNFYGGLAFGYTKGNGHLKNGSSDNDNWNFGLYGGWLGEKGQFVDVIVKRHRFKNDFDLHNLNGLASGGSYHNWATSFSVEGGWRFSCPTTGFYAEPQAELSFGRMESGSFTTSQGVKVKQNATNSTVGRLGVAAGYSLPENKGNAYVKASVLHDWSAKVKGSMSKDGLKQSYRDDLSGTWAEFSVGGTYNATKNISAYGEFQTSAGSPIRSPWSASVGVRYNF